MWCRRRGGAAGSPVQQVSCSTEGLDPEARWHGGMKEECTDTVIQSTKHTLGLAILWTSVGAGEAHDSAVGGEERAHGGVVELAPVVYLTGEHGALELGLHVGEESAQCG